MNIPVQISTALIGAASVILSAIISTRISKFTTKAEIKAAREQQNRVWEHEKEITENAEFSEMLTAVSEFLRLKSGVSYKTAIEKVNLIRIKAHGIMATQLDSLYYSIENNGDRVSVDNNEVKKWLACVIEEQRKQTAK